MIVLHQPYWVPFAIGVLAGAHFLPYVWIYDLVSNDCYRVRRVFFRHRLYGTIFLYRPICPQHCIKCDAIAAYL
jgi:hypothetical protein